MADRRLAGAALILLLSAPVAQLHAQRFEAAGIGSDSSVFVFLRTLQGAVAANDSNAVAALIGYPLRVNAPSGTYMVTGRNSFLARYQKILAPTIRQAIISQVPDSLFANWQGVMIGNGEVWFGMSCPPGRPADCERLAIHAINLP